MKTTLNIDDDLIREAKAVAARRGVTLTSLVQDALRAIIRPRPSTEEYNFDDGWIVREGAAAPGVNIADREALYTYMEMLEGPDFPPQPE